MEVLSKIIDVQHISPNTCININFQIICFQSRPKLICNSFCVATLALPTQKENIKENACPFPSFAQGAY